MLGRYMSQTKEKKMNGEKKQPRFSVLRPAGDLVGEIPGTDIRYEDLWRHDEYIHSNQFQKSELTVPEPPTKIPVASKISLYVRAIFKNRLFRSFILAKNDQGEKVLAKWAVSQNLTNYMAELRKLLAESRDYRQKVHDYNQQKTIEYNFKKVKDKAKHTCSFCGFQDKKYIEIHHIDGNHFNNKIDNLAAACTLCHRQHHLLWLSINNHAELGVCSFDFLPQTELNQIQRIAIVKKNDEKYGALLGLNGKLGTVIDSFKHNFSRPLHSFMQSEAAINQFESEYFLEHLLENTNGVKAKYKEIETAIENLHNTKRTPIQDHAVNTYDDFIGMQAEKKSDPNASEEDIRDKNLGAVQELMRAYRRKMELAQENAFNVDMSVFSIFELAVALKTVDYKDFKEFNPPNLYLIFNESIFTKEQLEYYKKQQFFNADHWDAS